MTTDTLEFPVIEEPATEVVDAAAPSKPEPAESSLVLIRRNTLAELSTVDRGIAALKAAHGAIDYDISTPKGLQAAKDHRMAVREARYKVPHIVKARKAELKTVTEALDAEAERITAALLAIEKPHDDAIKAREQVLADEKAARERLAAERRAKFEADIQALRGWLTRAQAPDMTAERIAKGIDMLQAMTFPVETWAEYAVPAANAQCETLAGMRALYAQVLAREQEAQRQREEAGRLAAEREAQRLQAEELARQRAELERQAAALRAEQQRIEHQRRWEEELERERERIKREFLAANPPAALEQTLDSNESDPGLTTPDAQEGVAQNPLQPQPETSPGEAAADGGARDVDVGASALAASCVTSCGGCTSCDCSNEYPEGRGSQEVLKAEPATADATDREATATTSPRVGAMGAEQPADAGLAGGAVVALLDHIAQAFAGRFPSHPKPENAWWDTLRHMADNLKEHH